MELGPQLIYIFRVLVVTVPIFLVIYNWCKKRAPFVAQIDKLPGPKKLPLLGNALKFVKTPVELFTQACTDVFEFGPIFRFWILSTPQVVIARAREAEKILQNIVHHGKSDNYRFLHTWMGQGLLTSKDEKWRVHRKVLTPAFHFNILNEFLPIFIKHSQKFVTNLSEMEEKKKSSKNGFNIFQYASLCSLDIICESSMGTAVDAQSNENSPYVQAVNSINELLVQRYFSGWLRIDWIFNLSQTKREMDKCLQTLNDFTDKVISERRSYLKTTKLPTATVKETESRHSLSFLDLLLAAEEKGCDHMTQKDIRDQVSTFMFEGHDTVSTAMSWALFMIGSHPEHQERIVDELVEVFGDSGRAPDISDLANLKYLERCIKETLRMFPSVPFIERGPTQDADLGDYLIPSGCTITFNLYMQHRDPEYWPDPEKFNPDRFLPENVKGRHPYAYIPFSAGPRNCIGQKFALMEEKVVLSTVLRRFCIEAAHTCEEAVLQVGMVLRPQSGLRVRIFDRDSHPLLRVQSSSVHREQRDFGA